LFYFLQEAKSCQITELTSVSSKEWERELLDDTIFLPKDLWTYVNMAQNGGTVIETGWLVNLDQSIVSGCQLESSGEIKVSIQQNCKRLYASVLTAIVIKVSHLLFTIKSSPFLFRTRVWSKTVFCNRPCMKNQGLAGGVLTQLFLPWIFLQEVYVRFEWRISKM
jgi:hypothetical protein